MGVYQWSQTAATDASVDPTINFAEGQAPSSLNDSARALMAAIAKWRDDNSGALVTGGTSTAFTVTSNQGFSSLSAMDGASIKIRLHAAIGASATLNVDSLGAKSLVGDASSGNFMNAGAIPSGGVVSLVYNNAGGFWIVVDGANSPFATGTKMLFQQTAAPLGWTKQVGNNDNAIRVVSGTAGSGGASAFSSVFAARTISQANLPSYVLPNTLSLPDHTHNTTVNATASVTTAATGGLQVPIAGSTVWTSAGANSLPAINGSVTSGGSGTTMDFNVAYVDVIIAMKN